MLVKGANGVIIKTLAYQFTAGITMRCLAENQAYHAARHIICKSVSGTVLWIPGGPLLTWINFNPCMDNQSYTQ